MDSMGSSRVVVLVVALGFMCAYIDSFVLPVQPIIARARSTRSVGRPDSSAPARTLSRGRRSTRMMAGALDVSCVLRAGSVGNFRLFPQRFLLETCNTSSIHSK